MGRIPIIGWHRYANVLEESSSPIARDPRSCQKRPTMTNPARKSIPTDLYESCVIQVFITLVSLVVVFLGTSIWAIVDTTSKPQAAFVSIGSSKSTWITLIAVFTLFFGLVGFILALTYLFSVRPKINNWSQSTFVASPPVTSGRSWVSFLLWLLVGVRARSGHALNARNRLVREPSFVPTVEPVPMTSPRHSEIRREGSIQVEDRGTSTQTSFRLPSKLNALQHEPIRRTRGRRHRSRESQRSSGQGQAFSYRPTTPTRHLKKVPSVQGP